MKLSSLIFVLCFGGLFFVVETTSAVIKKDAMVFKVASTVYSLVDLKELNRDLKEFACIYPSSLILKVFSKKMKSTNKDTFVYREKFSASQKESFKQFIEFAKLSIYSESQAVNLSPLLQKALYTNAKKNKCSLRKFEKNGDMKASLKDLVRFEVFARSRFLSNDKGTDETRSDIDKAIISAKSLMKSIGGQLGSEVYWLD